MDSKGTVENRKDAGTQPEERFVELFIELFGAEKAQYLIPEYAFVDADGKGRFVDYALKTNTTKVAFEIDGLQWHHPEAISIFDYEDQLLRQNSLIQQEWAVYRWTDRQIAHEPERVKDQLALFLEKASRFVAYDDFLPMQAGSIIDFREYQEEALNEIDRRRENGETISLLVHATGTGKTSVAIQDAKRVGGRTLFIAHRDTLVRQAVREFRRFWPERHCGLFLGSKKEPSAPIVCASIQSLSQNLEEFRPSDFRYIIIDEAHHATAQTYRSILNYFVPEYTLGLTATPERADEDDLLEIFRECSHRLSLEDAIKAGHLAPIRCVRVKTNIDLSKVRFNAVSYAKKDLETQIRIPARDKLIVETYTQNVPGKRAVAFSVNVAHAEALAELFISAGYPARAVSGRISTKDREVILSEFRSGKLLVLCACDVLNEGWNCPELEVLLMARPTLSKLLYMQQLGRGTRKAPGKKELFVFDFVDNSTRYSIPQSVHRIFRKNKYQAGGLVLGTDKDMQADADAFARGEMPMKTLHLSLWTRHFEEIDIFNWQELTKDMLSASEMELALAAGSGRIRNAAIRGDISADHSFTIGERTYYYFSKERQEELRLKMDLPVINRDTIKNLFLNYVKRMDMSSSYKPVFLQSFFAVCNKQGRSCIDDCAKQFKLFYENRALHELLVEKQTMRMAEVNTLTLDEVTRICLEMPFEKFGRRQFMQYCKDLAFIQIAPEIWKQLTDKDIDTINESCNLAIGQYYERITNCEPRQKRSD